ncbi:unnamed protein product [Amaranthus hypochondriacus]
MSGSGASVDKNTQRRWTYKEDQLLVKLLVEMFAGGKWKAKSGFRSGYLAHLEKLFAASMPEAKMKVSNIDSRLSYLRKRFNALQDIKLKGSGFGWDDNQKMMTSDRKLFEDWAKSHKDAKDMFRKPFPFYDDVELIYSKDRAMGSKAIMPADKDDEETMLQDTTPSKEEDVPSEVSATNKRVVDEGSSKEKAKKKSNSQIEKLVSVLEAPKNSKSIWFT